MRLLYKLFYIASSVFFAQPVLSQIGFPTGINGTVINVPCASDCNNLQVKIPHLKTTDDYLVRSIPYNPYAYVTAAPALTHPCVAGANSQDDKFLDTTTLPFRFCFYEGTYGKLVVGTNGNISFDSTNALRGNNYVFNASTTLPYAGPGGQGSGVCPTPTGILFPRASIMGPYYDIYPQPSDLNYKIETRTEGIAPVRRFITSFFNIQAFGCSALRGTSQIVLYESSGLVEVYIGEKPSCASGGGRAILGIQNWARDKGVVAPGKNSTQWSESNTAYRFLPSGITSRFMMAEIYDLAGTLLQTTTPADTTTTTPGLLDINFNNICFIGASKQFVVKAYFASCLAGPQLISSDTITVVKGNSTANVSSTAAGCSPNGTATITMSSGSGPYTFAIGTNAPVASANNSYTFTGLIAGTYTLTGTNTLGCITTSTVTISLNGTLNIQAIPAPPTCAGLNNGSIVVTPQNGTRPYQYNINNGVFQLSNTFNNLAPSTYVIGARDSSGCVVANYIVNIAAASPVVASLSGANVSCNGSTNGSITVAFSSNASPLQYSLDGVTYQVSNSFNGLGAGTYTVYYRDANNCGGTQNFTITQPSALAQTVTGINAVCNGGNGSISVTGSGGTPGYQYSIDSVSYQTANTFTVAAGTYNVYIRDAVGCIFSSSITITQPATLAATAATENATCNGGADGKITITANAGTAPYQYSINGTVFQVSNIFNVPQGNYAAIVKDVNNCTTTANALVGLTNNLTVSLSADTTICEGTTAALRVTSNATQFLWSPAASLNDATSVNPTAWPNDTTQYILTATLGVCTRKDSLVVNVNPQPVADAGVNDEVCFGQEYVLQGNGGVMYQWSPTTYFDNGNISSTQNPSISPLQTITYALMVTDAAGCKSLSPANVTITVTPPIKVNVFPVDTIVARGDVIQLRANSPVNDYIWSPAFGLDNTAKQNPVATINTDIEYIVTAYTGAGCKGTDTVKIKVYNGPEIYVPTAFTPNGDGKNELLLPFPVGIKELKFFRVYNRWGQLVFETKNLSQGWNGKLGSVLQPMAAYVWVLEAVTKENKVLKKKGTTTLIR